MSLYIPTAVIVPIANVATINGALRVLKSGNYELVARFCHKDTPTGPVTHHGFLDMGANQSNVDEWAAMCLGILPAIHGEWGGEWDEIAIPEANDVIAACIDGGMQVFPGYGVQDPGPFIAGILHGFDLVPFVEI